MLLFNNKKPIISFLSVLIICGVLTTAVIAESGNDLTINYIESQAAQEQMNYDVAVTFSFLDGAGNPVKDLKLENITLSEDGQGVEPLSLDIVTDQPIYISLLIDTSGSMNGSRNDDAVAAATKFVSGLNPEDRIAVTTFNSEIKNLIDFSTDHSAATNLISGIEAEANSGTCLYDALYEAIQNTAALPLGRRAVVILSDGKDESPEGGPCSKLTIDDVIDIASEGNTRVPVFIVGLGEKIDEDGLVRISTLTGGYFEKTPDSTKLESTFVRLLELLQSQYMLHYTSNSAPGNHTLVVKTDYLNSKQSDSRDFVLPALPLRLTIVSPVDGQEISDKTKIVASISGQGNPISQVVFSVNDTVLGSDETTPYEMDWTPDSSLNGDATINVKAVGPDGSELVANSVMVSINTTGGIVSTTPVVGEVSTKIFGFLPKDKLLLFGGILAGVIAAVVILIVVISKNKKKDTKKRDDQWNNIVGGSSDKSDSMNEMTMDGFPLSENSLGAIMVMQSDDPSMVGQRFEISEDSIRLGRAADNDILFPKDGAVSRHHAIIENINGQLRLSELVSAGGDGTTKAPTFGTFVNDQKVFQPVALRSGDLIRLGKRVVLKFESAKMHDEDDDARTIDQFNVDDMDRTIDS